jgi:hypothetical protein
VIYVLLLFSTIEANNVGWRCLLCCAVLCCDDIPFHSIIIRIANMADDIPGATDDPTVTLSEWIEAANAEEELEYATAAELAAAGGEHINSCSYIEGYAEQAVYACKKCYPQQFDPASNNSSNNYDKSVGFCLGCSMNCHVDCGDNIIELYLKRDFRCDCGNSKATLKCQLDPNKQSFNYNNKYNHNFVDRFCHCDGEYKEGEEYMIQCLMCQDWLAYSHTCTLHILLLFLSTNSLHISAFYQITQVPFQPY